MANKSNYFPRKKLPLQKLQSNFKWERFTVKDYWHESLEGDVRWKYGTPPEGNANYAWLQHMIHHLAPNGSAGIVLANGSLSSNTSGEGEIRKNMLEADIVDCIVALPDKLFLTTGIPACLWFLNRNKENPKQRNRKNEVLFIDARKMGELVERSLRELTPEEITKIADTYHMWRGTYKGEESYQDIQGFCKSATLEDIKKNDYILTPGRYVGVEEEEDDGIPYEEKMKNLTTELGEYFKRSKELEDEIKANLKELGFEI